MSKRVTNSSEELSTSSETSSSLSSDEETDVRDLKSIKEYLSDRRELARQLFKSVKAEKIRMMLPQTLKKINLDELEEWCASELSGMSKTRILCILNGKTMLESSNTSESDDSGPSLEIISDTEEWFTDDETSKKDEGSQSGKIKPKKDNAKLKGKSQTHKRNDSKFSQKKGSYNNHKDVQVKKEEEKEPNKEKEGDSLLDLLELEMRARAIRALIRKEEDIIPTTSASKLANNDSVNENNVNKIAQDELKEKENCRRQLEKIISAQRGSAGDDEDVVLVVQPTPTIELLSSDSEGESHSGARINQKLQNERTMETMKKVGFGGNEHTKNLPNISVKDNLEKNKKSQEIADTCKNSETRKNDILKRAHSNNVDDKIVEPVSTKTHVKKRKMKRKSHVKQQSKSLSPEEELSKSVPCDPSENNKTDTKSGECLPIESPIENLKNVKSDNSELQNLSESKVKEDIPLSEQNDTKVQNAGNKVPLEEDKSTDFDEIIDLDDYGDDMEDMENIDNDKIKKKQIAKTEQCISQGVMCSLQKPNASETWASRYYQTDDVQSVIKESKIQSEIRKRLRERQRLSKLSKSPTGNSPSSSPATEVAGDKFEYNPMGSVNEYLALKCTASVNLNTNNCENDTNATQGVKISDDSCADVVKLDTKSQEDIESFKSDHFDKETNISVNSDVTTSLDIKKDETAVESIETKSVSRKM